MQLRFDQRKDAQQRAARELGISLEKFRARMELLRAQGEYMKTVLGRRAVNHVTVAEEARANSVAAKE